MRKGKIAFMWGEFNKKWELVSWHENNTTNHVVAFFEKHKEGYDMRTVGNRFFEDEDSWIVAKHAMAFLTELFDKEQYEQQ